MQIPRAHFWLLPQSSSLSHSLSQIECSQTYPDGQYIPESQAKQITPPEHTPYGAATENIERQLGNLGYYRPYRFFKNASRTFCFVAFRVRRTIRVVMTLAYLFHHKYLYRESQYRHLLVMNIHYHLTHIFPYKYQQNNSKI